MKYEVQTRHGRRNEHDGVVAVKVADGVLRLERVDNAIVAVYAAGEWVNVVEVPEPKP